MKPRREILLRATFARLLSLGAATAVVLLATISFGAQAEPAGAASPSVIKGKPAGINVGDYAPDFQLEPIEISADFKRWLGDKAPKTFEDKIMLSDFVGKAPIVLLFGSFT